MDYADEVIEIIRKYVKSYQQQQPREKRDDSQEWLEGAFPTWITEKRDDSQEWLEGAFPIGTSSSSSKKKKKK